MTTMLEVAPGRIIMDPNKLGGKPHIAGTRVAVHHVVVWHDRLGMRADEIATEYGLALSDIYAALAFYHAHPDEINAAIHTEDRFVTEMQRQYPSKLRQKLGA